MPSMKIGLLYPNISPHPISWLIGWITNLCHLKNSHMIGGLPPTIHLINPINFILW
jgi:hypothetical protein